MEHIGIKKIAMLLLVISTATITMASACSKDDHEDDVTTPSIQDYSNLIVGKWNPVSAVNIYTYKDGHTEREESSGESDGVWEFASTGAFFVNGEQQQGISWTVHDNQLSLIALFVPINMTIISLTNDKLILELTNDGANAWLGFAQEVVDGEYVNVISQVEFRRVR